VFAAKKINVWRIVNAHDVVPQIPFMKQNYRHTGQLVYYQKFIEGETEPRSDIPKLANPKFCGFTAYDKSAS